MTWTRFEMNQSIDVNTSSENHYTRPLRVYGLFHNSVGGGTRRGSEDAKMRLLLDALAAWRPKILLLESR